MRVLAALLIVGLSAIAAQAARGEPLGASYDREPVALSGLKPDRWGVSITGAENYLYRRYAGIASVRCRGVIMLGWPLSESSWVHGMTRYWDKVFCSGSTRNGRTFSLIADPKSGRSSFGTVYRLKGASIRDLLTP
jgi:hypothetical protein